MLFTKDGVTYEVKDKAHIDCFRAKGWKEVPDKPTAKKQVAEKNKK